MLLNLLTAGTDITQDIFDGVTTVLGKVVTFFGTAITNVLELFWVSGTGLTQYGKLFIIPAGFMIFYKCMKWVAKLVRIR